MTVDNNNEIVTIGEAAGRYLATVPEKDKAAHQQAVNAFMRWYNGADKPVNTLSAMDASVYAEQEAQRDGHFGAKVGPFKVFLAYLRKQGWVTENLAIGIKVKKTKGRTTGPAQKLKREPVPLSQARYDELAAELSDLRVKRLEVTKDVTIAAADKDFRENAPFHAARERKGHIEGRMMELEETLARAVITEQPREKTHTVCIGNTLVLVALPSEREFRYTLVNPKEVAPSKGLISTISPVGKAAMGRCAGDTIEVVVPSGKVQYRIKCIER